MLYIRELVEYYGQKNGEAVRELYLEKMQLAEGRPNTQKICRVVAVRDTRKALSALSAAFFDHPAEKMKMIGITGTNGKTTTAFLTAGILQEAGYRVGMIGTIESYDGRRRETVKNTTPESCEIHRLLSRMVENECDCCVM